MKDWEHEEADSLRNRLLAIDGIDDAELDGDDDAPTGVRIRLAVGADADRVGDEVKRVLALRGVASHLAEAPEMVGGPPPPPGARLAVVGMPGVDTTTSEGEGITVDLRGAGLTVDERLPEAEHREDSEPVPERPFEPEPGTDTAGRGLSSIAVEEGRTGVTVTVRGDGRLASRRARATGVGLDEAIVAAVGEILLASSTPPLLVEARSDVVDGTNVVTVLLEIGEGVRRVGAAILEGGRAYAIARAAWLALSERD